MNKRTLLFSILMAGASLAYGASPSVSVTVSNASGKVAFKGKTNSAGAFATGKLQPGDYVVQFNSEGMPKGNYALIISAGKQKVSSESVPPEKFSKGGVAMRIKVGDNMNVSGQVTSGKAAVALAGDGNSKVKIVNGKRWFWVIGSTGSNIGGHWVEEGTPEARNLQGLSNSAVGRMQERGPSGLSGN